MSLSNHHSTKKERNLRDPFKTSFNFNLRRSTQNDNSSQAWKEVVMARPNAQEYQETTSNELHRRTFQSSTSSEKQAVTIRKTKSLRESSRSKFRSPPPPKHSRSEIINKLPFVKRNSNITEKKKYITDKIPGDMLSANKTLSEYQGYSRHSKHGSFTYSPPPTNINETNIPDVPPVPKIHSFFKSQSDSLRRKESSTVDMSNILNVDVHRNDHRGNNIPQMQRELDCMLSDLPDPGVMRNIDKELAQIEEDIKALALERDRHSSFINNQNIAASTKTNTTGRKRGKTLPGNLAVPPSIPTLVLPPMTLNPLQVTIPSHFRKNQSLVSSTIRQSTSTTTSTNKTKHSVPSSRDDPVQTLYQSLDIGMGTLDKKLSLPDLQERKSHGPSQTARLDVSVHRTTSHRQQNAVWEDGDLQQKESTLTSDGLYLSNDERQHYAHVYYIGPHVRKHGFDDDRGDYKIMLQDHLAYRYEVLGILGRGSFGQVVKCFDHKLKQTVAIKIIRNKKRFYQQALTEIHILKKLREWDPKDRYRTIKMTHYFEFRHHLCIAFECLTMNLYELIKRNHFQGFSLGFIKRITYQILQSLLLLAEHEIIHCDLKPENIMLKHPGESSIKVIDFGSSCLESERVYTYIQSRFYRSPEVILGISYHKAIDMWSLGCIIAELYTGAPLFPGENEQEQLGCIMEVMGLPERHIIEKSSRRKLFFDTAGNPRIVVNSKGKKRLPCTKSLYQVLKCNDLVFLDFVEQCLQWDPSRRMTPKSALQHEWLNPNRSNRPVKPISFSSSFREQQ